MRRVLLGKILTHAGRWLVICFCLFHMTAVLAMAIPQPATGMHLQLVRNRVRPLTDPYLQWTSQWQIWDLFSPNPSNQITEARIEYVTPDAWVTLQTFSGETVSAWRKADTFKLLGRIQNDDGQKMRDLFLFNACKSFNVPERTVLRLVMRTRLINRENPLDPPSVWQEDERALVVCP